MQQESLVTDLAEQLRRACTVLEHHLGDTMQAVHLFGSAIDGGLKPRSDVDLLVTVRQAPEESVRRALMCDLLAVSAPPGASDAFRPLEVTVVAHGEVVPWRYPARRELQFGEWLREDLLAGVFEPPMPDHDLAVLLTQARQHSVALRGPVAAEVFAPVLPADFRRALADTVAQWNEAPDWAGDERNIVLALARIGYSVATGRIAPKDMAAAWLLEQLPAAHQAVLRQARDAYLGLGEDTLASQPVQTAAFIRHARAVIEAQLAVP